MIVKLPKFPKDLQKTVKQALRQGWVLTHKAHGHPKLTAPSGYSVPIPTTTTNPNTISGVIRRIEVHQALLDNGVKTK